MSAQSTPRKKAAKKAAEGTPTPSKKQKTTQTTSYDLPGIYKSSLFSDFKIQTRKKTFDVHRIILASKGGKFFHGIVTSGMSEAQNGVLDLSDDQPEAVETLISFIYESALEIGSDYELDDLIQLYILGDKYDVPGLRERVIKLVSDAAENLIADGALNGWLSHLSSPPAEHPAHCYAELMQALVAVAASTDHIRDTLRDEDTCDNLSKYGVLAGQCTKTLQTLLDAEERKLGNINAVACNNATCPGRNRRWTFKHGPRGSNARHCVWCGDANHIVTTP